MLFESREAFFDELEKIAKPVWARRLMDLSPAAREKVLSSISKAREVQRLGYGGERIADLMAHPTYGLSVRKVPLFRSSHPEHIKGVEEFSALQRQMEGRLKEIAGGKGPFAHILGEGPKGEAYYQFAKGAPADADLVRRFEKARAVKEQVRARQLQARKAYTAARSTGSPKASKAKETWQRLREEMRDADAVLSEARRQFYLPLELPPGAKGVLEKLKADYPRMHDLRGSNIVEGKIVDFSPRVQSTIMRAPYPKSPVGFSKSRIFGKK